MRGIIQNTSSRMIVYRFLKTFRRFLHQINLRQDGFHSRDPHHFDQIHLK